MNRRVVALAVAIAVLLGAATVAVVGRDGDDRPARRAASGAPASVHDVVAEVEAFVSRTRGLAFERAVPVDLVEPEEFRRRLLDDMEEQRADTEVDERVLRALGLLPDDVELFDVAVRFIGESVVGFYDPEAHELVVRGTSFGPYARMVLAHELTHALDDQHFGLDRPGLDDEAAVAFDALAEGDAVRVQEAYRRQLPADEQDRLAEEEADVVGSVDVRDVPLVVLRALTFPYTAGPRFVDALERAGGHRRVDEAFVEPPTTTDDILDPAAWLTGRRHERVPRPDAPATTIDSGVFGRYSLVLTLETVVGTDEAERAAEGWRGDAYVAWDQPGGTTCVRATFVLADAGELGELVVSLDAWANERHATVERSPTRAGFTVCG